MLFIPGHKLDWMLKVAKYGADALLFDLEDSIDLSEKQAARNALASAIRQLCSDPFGRLSGCNGHRAKGAWLSTMNRGNWQREEPEAQRKAAAFNRWHARDHARVSSPGL